MRMRTSRTKIPLFLLIVIVGCTPLSTDEVETMSVPIATSLSIPIETRSSTQMPVQEPTQTAIPTQEILPMTESIFADVLSVQVTGSANTYQFNVQVSSPDTGCDQYADWWEVLSEDGQLLYRRVLLHSHVSEQPFTRSGGPVTVDEGVVVIVRAHMNNGGYGGAALRGSAYSGFETVQLGSGFAAEVEAMAPLPDGCAF